MFDSRYALLTTIVLGIAHMCMFVGYDTGSFIVESVLHSVHDRRPDEMDEHAGYYGQAIVNAFNMVGHIVAPAILCVINAKFDRSTLGRSPFSSTILDKNPARARVCSIRTLDRYCDILQGVKSCWDKWTMVIGSVFFSISFASYILMNEYVIYVSSAFLGLLFAVFNAGYSRYITQISTVATIEKINGLEWSIACLSTLVGGFLYIPLTLMDPKSSEPSLYREYSDTQIRLMYGTFTVIGIISNVIFCFLPTREVDNSISSIAKAADDEKGGKAAKIRESIKLTLKSFFDPLVLQLSPHFIYVGWQNSIWLSVYPTTLQFTESLSSSIFVTAYYGMTFSIGSLTMGTLMGPLSRRIVRFGQTPCLVLAAGLQLLCGTLILLSTPNMSTISPNDDPSLLIPPNVPLALAMGFLFGLLDGCNNTNRTVMCATALPAKRAQVFAIARFYQALSGSILLFASPILTTYWMLGIEAVLFLIGASFYLRVVSLLNKSHRPNSQTQSDDTQSISTISKEVDQNGNDLRF